MAGGSRPDHLSQSGGAEPGEPLAVHAKLHRVGAGEAAYSSLQGRERLGKRRASRRSPSRRTSEPAPTSTPATSELTVLALQLDVARAYEPPSGDIDDLRVHEVAHQEQLVLGGLRAAVELLGGPAK